MTPFFARLFGRAGARLAEAGPREAASIASLHAASFRRGWSEEEVEALLLDRAVIGHVALNGDRVAGFVISRRAADEAEILSVAVESRRRGRGLGRGLLDLHLRRLAGQGARAVFLEVDEANAAAVRLYARAGFRQVGRRPDYYPKPGGPPAAALVLRRDLV